MRSGRPATRSSGSAHRRRTPEASGTAAAKLDRGPAGSCPGGDPAVPDRMRIEAARGEDAGRDRRPWARLADRHDRPVAREIRLPEREQAIRDVATARDVAGIALVLFADVDQLRAVCEQGVQLVDRHELERLRSTSEDVSDDLEQADRAERA